MKHLYQTTTGTIRWDSARREICMQSPAPAPPDTAHEWELVNSIVSYTTGMFEKVHWYWRRPIGEWEKKDEDDT